MNHLEHLSEQELADIIAQASKALEQKREHAKRDVMAQMKALAASIGVQVEIKECRRAGRSERFEGRDQIPRSG